MRGILAEILQDADFAEGKAWYRCDFSAGEVIVREGDEDRRMFLIEKGSLRVVGRVELEDQRAIQPGLCDLYAGDMFGELTLFEPHPRTASVTAIDDGQLVVIDCMELSLYLEQRPEVGYALLKSLFNVLIDRLSKANQRVEHLFAWGLKVHGIDKHL